MFLDKKKAAAARKGRQTTIRLPPGKERIIIINGKIIKANETKKNKKNKN